MRVVQAFKGQIMWNIDKSLIVTAVLWAAGASAAFAQSQAADPTPRSLVVADYTVFLDPPTGFVFVKLPQGWKFAGTVEPGDLGRVPTHVVTTLLMTDSEVASRERRKQAP